MTAVKKKKSTLKATEWTTQGPVHQRSLPFTGRKDWEEEYFAERKQFP